MGSRNPDFGGKKKVGRPKTDGRSAPLRAVALSEAAYKAADELIDHGALCRECTPMLGCDTYDSLAGEYSHKRGKALQAIRKVRGASSRPVARRAKGSK
jgi:hypothetical protein